MKIDLTNNEYTTLLEMIYLSEWILHTFNIDNVNVEHKTLRQKIYSLYKDFQSEGLLEEALGELNESESFHKKMYKFIEHYNQSMFWESLIDQLSYRDLIKELGTEALNKLDMLEKMEKLEKYRESYSNEFNQHQIDHIKIDYSNQIKN